jgi:hypothetical protein
VLTSCSPWKSCLSVFLVALYLQLWWISEKLWFCSSSTFSYWYTNTLPTLYSTRGFWVEIGYNLTYSLTRSARAVRLVYSPLKSTQEKTESSWGCYCRILGKDWQCFELGCRQERRYLRFWTHFESITIGFPEEWFSCMREEES